MISYLEKPLNILKKILRRSKILSLIPITLLAVISIYHVLYIEKIYPGVYVANQNLGGLTRDQAARLLKNTTTKKIIINSENPKFEKEIKTDEINIKYAYDKTSSNAYLVGRNTNPFYALNKKFKLLFKPESLPFVLETENENLTNVLDKIATEIDTPAIEPEIVIENNNIVVNTGKDGLELDRDNLKEKIINTIAFNKTDNIRLPIKTVNFKLTNEKAELAAQRAKNIIGKSFEIKLEDETFRYKDKDIVSLISYEGLRSDRLSKVIEGIVKVADRPPQDAKLTFAENKVKEFTPAKDGIKTNTQELEINIKAGIEELVISDKKLVSIMLPTTNTKPAVSIGEINNLGIKERIGRGSSRFAGSIPSRVHNIDLAASRINGTLIKPGESLSFNTLLGDVSVYTGYEQAYVIREGRTVLGDGGGVCQVSTTLFRAALNAGLPIEERRAHSYRVGYYEQDSKPGLDATVYSPSPDLKIKNDTDGHILIQTKLDKKTSTLVFELYGTSDGRVAQIGTPKIWDITPPPPPLYQDDPSLPAGTTKQIEYASTGSKASFTYKVTKNGEVLQNKTFSSNYRPWQAVYLKGVQPTQ